MSEIQLPRFTVVLVVDDDPLCRAMIRHMIEPDDVMILEAESIEGAWRLLSENTAIDVDVVLLDRQLPDGDGLTLVPKIRSIPNLAWIPVIIQSGLIMPEQISEGLASGVYHYLEKPYDRNMLRTLIRLSVNDSREHRRTLKKLQTASEGLNFMTFSEFRMRTLDDVGNLVPFLAQHFPSPETAAVGLSELLINAVEHGNLEISYDDKTHLLLHNRWSAEIEYRLVQPKYMHRSVTIQLSRLEDRVLVKIADEGSGFNWHDFEQLDEKRIFHIHGRGIALARNSCFDAVEYSGLGNVVTCYSLLR